MQEYLDKPLSPSRMNSFLDCELLFRYRTIDRLPERPGNAAFKGTLIHSVLEDMFDLDPSLRTVENIVTTTWQQLTFPADVAIDQALVNEVLTAQRDSYRLRKRYLRPDGAVVWGDLTVTCLRSTDGTVDFFLGQMVDVTDTVTEAAAYRLMVENSSGAVFSATPDAHFTYVSPSVRGLIG